MKKKDLLKLPSVSEVLLEIKDNKYHNDSYIKYIIKDEIESFRSQAKQGNLQLDRNQIIQSILLKLTKLSTASIKPVINATGIILHTGLGRAPVGKTIISKVSKRLSGYVNLELNLETGKRGQRQEHISALISSITGAQDAMVVNNNAAAVLLSLNELAEGKDVIVSRGQLVEIGGSFRIPDMIAKSGCRLVEVGTTNRTHIGDYENAISSNTGLILWVHTSNYTISGFTKQVEIGQLVELGRKKRIPVMSDLGCGEVLDLSKKGIPTNMIVRDVIKSGSSITTFSGDKLLGGPQCGLIVGKRPLIKRIKVNPIARTVRCDKWTISMLEETLRSLRVDSLKDNLTISLMMTSRDHLSKRAKKLLSIIPTKLRSNHNISIQETLVEAGSGTLPGATFDSIAFKINSKKYTPAKLSYKFRNAQNPVVGYIKGNSYYIDFKSIIPHQEKLLLNSILEVLG